MSGPTGDIGNNYEKLRRGLIALKYDRDIDEEAICKGSIKSLLPILHYVFLSFSREFAEFVSEKGYALAGKNDLRFVEAIYRLLRIEFDYFPVLAVNRFLSTEGFAERKIMFTADCVDLVRKKHDELCGGDGGGGVGSSRRSGSQSIIAKKTISSQNKMVSKRLKTLKKQKSHRRSSKRPSAVSKSTSPPPARDDSDSENNRRDDVNRSANNGASPYSHDSSSPRGRNADDSDVDLDNISPLRSERDPACASQQSSATKESKSSQGHPSAASICIRDDDRLPLGMRRSTSPSSSPPPRVLFASAAVSDPRARGHTNVPATRSERHFLEMRNEVPVQETLKSTHERLAQTLAMQRERLQEHHDVYDPSNIPSQTHAHGPMLPVSDEQRRNLNRSRSSPNLERDGFSGANDDFFQSRISDDGRSLMRIPADFNQRSAHDHDSDCGSSENDAQDERKHESMREREREEGLEEVPRVRVDAEVCDRTSDDRQGGGDGDGGESFRESARPKASTATNAVPQAIEEQFLKTLAELEAKLGQRLDNIDARLHLFEGRLKFLEKQGAEPPSQTHSHAQASLDHALAKTRPSSAFHATRSPANGGVNISSHSSSTTPPAGTNVSSHGSNPNSSRAFSGANVFPRESIVNPNRGTPGANVLSHESSPNRNRGTHGRSPVPIHSYDIDVNRRSHTHSPAAETEFSLSSAKHDPTGCDQSSFSTRHRPTHNLTFSPPNQEFSSFQVGRSDASNTIGDISSSNSSSQVHASKAAESTEAFIARLQQRFQSTQHLLDRATESTHEIRSQYQTR